MRAPFYLACWAMVAVAGGGVASEEAVVQQAPRHLLEPVDVAADRETVAYLLPRLAAKYRPSGEWSDVTDPRFYVLTEMDQDESGFNEDQDFVRDSRRKRAGRLHDPAGPAGSLSIVNSLDVLRNRLLLEIARKKAKEGATRNRQMLMNLGKRTLMPPPFIQRF